MRPSHLDTRSKYDLSARQAEVLELIAQGLTNAEIADRLGISLDGAKYHVREILGKFGVDSREAAAAEWRHGRSPLSRLRRAQLGWPGWLIAKPVVAVGGIAGTGAIALAAAFFALGGGPARDPAAQPEATVQAEATTSASATVAPSPSAEAALLPCTSANTRLILELVPVGDNVHLRLSADGAERCRLAGPGWLHLIRPPSDPGPVLPPHANLDRSFKAVVIDFPFAGRLAEWEWKNWCAPGSAHVWEARLGSANGGYLVAQTGVDEFPTCVKDGAPTTVQLESTTAGLDADVRPLDTCPGVAADWQCEFAVRVAFDATHGGLARILQLGQPEWYTCTVNGQVQGMEYSDLCKGAAPGDVRRGYPLALHGSEGGPRSEAALLALLRPLFDAPATPYLGAIGFPAAPDSTGDTTFIVAFATPAVPIQPAVAYLTFRLAPGREPTFTGAGISGDNAAVILAGGTTITGLGQTTFVALPQTP